MKYPHINKERIKDNVDYWNTYHPGEGSIFMKAHNCYDYESFEKEWFNASKPFDKNLERYLITMRENSDLITNSSKIVIDKLLGDSKIRNKLRFIYDGSYYNNRIWFEGFESGINCIFMISVTQHDKDYFNKLPIKKKIDWMYNHFDYIYVMVDSMLERKDIVRVINTKKAYDSKSYKTLKQNGML